MESYGWELASRSFRMIDIQVTGIYESEKLRKDRDESIMNFILFNIVEEYSADFFEQFTVINYHDLSVGLFVVLPEQTNTSMIVNHFSDGVSLIINRLLDLKATITISNPAQQVKLIPQLFEEVRRGKAFRTIENVNQIIDLSRPFYMGSESQVYYPFDTEKEIVQAIRRGAGG